MNTITPRSPSFHVTAQPKKHKADFRHTYCTWKTYMHFTHTRYIQGFNLLDCETPWLRSKGIFMGIQNVTTQIHKFTHHFKVTFPSNHKVWLLFHKSLCQQILCNVLKHRGKKRDKQFYWDATPKHVDRQLANHPLLLDRENNNLKFAFHREVTLKQCEIAG